MLTVECLGNCPKPLPKLSNGGRPESVRKLEEAPRVSFVMVV
jgi:hypothetical protein